MSTSSLGMITSPGVAEVLEDMTMVEMLFSPVQAVLLPSRKSRWTPGIEFEESIPAPRANKLCIKIYVTLRFPSFFSFFWPL